MFPKVPQASLGILRVPQLPPPLEHPHLKNPMIEWHVDPQKADSMGLRANPQCLTLRPTESFAAGDPYVVALVAWHITYKYLSLAIPLRITITLQYIRFD